MPAAAPKIAPRQVIPSISIKDAMTGRPEPKATMVEKTEPPQPEDVSDEQIASPANANNKPVIQEELETAWNSFANMIKTEDTRLFSTLTAHMPLAEGEAKIVFQIRNLLQKEPLQKILSKLLQHLRTALNNENIEIEIIVIEKNETGKAYTAEDKFAQMSRKNPSLLTFKQQFGLDFD